MEENKELSNQSMNDVEVEIAMAENELLEYGKYVSADLDESHEIHLKKHLESTTPNMILKSHVEAHKRMLKDKLRQRMEKLANESEMVSPSY